MLYTVFYLKRNGRIKREDVALRKLETFSRDQVVSLFRIKHLFLTGKCAIKV